MIRYDLTDITEEEMWTHIDSGRGNVEVFAETQRTSLAGNGWT